MKIKKPIIIFIFFISMITLTETSKAVLTSNTYKQGIYNISEANPFRATAKLFKAPLGTNSVTSLSIVDSNGNQKFYNRFDNESEVVDLGPITNVDTIAIIGKGEIAITFNK